MSAPRVLRAAVVVLLIAALACLFLNQVRISFDQTAIDQVKQLTPSFGQQLPQTCVDDGLVSYSGIALMINSAPAVNRACLNNLRDASGAQLGVQPAMVGAALLIVAAIVVAALGTRWHRALVATLCVLAATLLFVDDLRFFDAFQAHFGGAGSVAGPSLLHSQASEGLWAMLGLLAAAFLICLGYEAARLSRRALAPITS